MVNATREILYLIKQRIAVLFTGGSGGLCGRRAVPQHPHRPEGRRRDSPVRNAGGRQPRHLDFDERPLEVAIAVGRAPSLDQLPVMPPDRARRRAWSRRAYPPAGAHKIELARQAYAGGDRGEAAASTSAVTAPRPPAPSSIAAGTALPIFVNTSSVSLRKSTGPCS